jgi:hypothetical protein
MMTDDVAIDLGGCPRDGHCFVMPEPPLRDGETDYVALPYGKIWSIGRRLSDGAIHASLGTDLYLNPDYDCLWLR